MSTRMTSSPLRRCGNMGHGRGPCGVFPVRRCCRRTGAMAA
ncbi:hypothetical protein DESPIGER_1146 [Desulfovibrio piger]|uniref:Uncharacterized protein n=1 Tax=Desulfovibrio piger TaxID=901 RepID=A0A1K1LHQ4_9BACT|nr:hypothetical protein DESPIGER_1146 [Desulfovibrio piger]